MTSNATIEIDRGRALDLLAGAVEKRGADYVYPNAQSGAMCRYAARGEADCMIAQALFDAGVTMDVIASLDSLGGINDNAVLNKLQINGVILTPGAISAFQRAQSRQDRAYTWGVAYDAASSSPEIP